jgi:hypothetical protein
MVYGLIRTDALESCGALRRVVLPDRLLLAELALRGELHQVPELLWHRRGARRSSGEASRQRERDSVGDAWTWLPWSLQHAAAIFWNDGVRGAGRPATGRIAGLAAGVAYLVLSPGFRAARAVSKMLGRSGATG